MNLLDISLSNPRLRGPQNITGSDGKEYRIFICHGCQSCWGQDPDSGKFVEYYPHLLSMEVLVPLKRTYLQEE